MFISGPLHITTLHGSLILLEGLTPPDPLISHPGQKYTIPIIVQVYVVS